VTSGVLGSAALWAAIALGLLAAVTARRWALIWSAAAGVVSTTILTLALLGGDFSLEYVAATTSVATPWPYRLAALWGGMDGSMLFYSTLTVLVVAWASKNTPIVRVAAGVAAGLLAVTLFFANPFHVTDVPGIDGTGLLAILQHPAMIYHPPVLYLGLVVLAVPFAFGVSGLHRADRGRWMAMSRRWLLISWALLTLGMAFGANWAYVELGWGGFWAWDPVENTALMPWLAITVFLHTSRVEEDAGRLRRWNVTFAGLPFALSLMGVYLTRSGVTGSIHSFAEDPVVGRVLLGAAAVVAAIVVKMGFSSRPGDPWGPIRAGRSTWLALNGALLATVLVFVTTGSAYPAFVAVFREGSLTVDSRFFVETVLPIAVVVAVALSLALRAGWRIYAVITAAVLVTGLVVVGPRPGVTLFAPALVSVGALGYLLVWKRGPTRLRAAQIAHLGMAVFLVGVAGSSFGDDFTGAMMPGDRVSVGGHEIALVAIETGEADRYLFVKAVFDVDGSLMEPEIRAYESQEVPVAEPAFRSTPVDDVVIAVSLLFPDRDTVAVSALVRPLVWWVWVGALLMGLGGLIALSWQYGVVGRRRRSARAAPRPGGTTTGTASR